MHQKNAATAKLSIEDVQHVVRLAKLPIEPSRVPAFHEQLQSVLSYMSGIQELPTTNVPETSQVTGLTNVLREDVIDTKRMFTQQQALANTKRQHNGYVLVNAVLEEA